MRFVVLRSWSLSFRYSYEWEKRFDRINELINLQPLGHSKLIMVPFEDQWHKNDVNIEANTEINHLLWMTPLTILYKEVAPPRSSSWGALMALLRLRMCLLFCVCMYYTYVMWGKLMRVHKSWFWIAITTAVAVS